MSNYTHIDHFLGIVCIAFFLLKIERFTVLRGCNETQSLGRELCVIYHSTCFSL